MSAFLCSVTHIRVIVSAASAMKYPTIRALPVAAIDHDPTAFARLSANLLSHPGALFPVKTHEDELGRALMLSNVASMAYRYPKEDWADEFADACAYRHAYAPRTPVEVIKACHCLAYQSCEVNDWENTWACHAIAEIEKDAVKRLPGYEAAPWAIDDPTGGPPEPGTEGAPVSILSLVPRRPK